jgi:hypothetical protein
LFAQNEIGIDTNEAVNGVHLPQTKAAALKATAPGRALAAAMAAASGTLLDRRELPNEEETVLRDGAGRGFQGVGSAAGSRRGDDERRAGVAAFFASASDWRI